MSDKIYSVIVLKNPETDGLSLFLRKSKEILNDNVPMLIWDKLTWDEAITKRDFLKKCLL